jgi:protein-tyrosine-phosphatase
MKKILFVCVENSNRSQMAEAFVKLHYPELKSFSAGSNPSGRVNPKAVASMLELGYDLSKHHSKSLEEIKPDAPFDVVVTMGCGDACPWMPAKRFVDWQIPDPKNMESREFNEVRDLISQKVNELVASLS